MSTKNKILFKKRAFLNDDVSMSGFVIAVLEEFEYSKDGTKVSSYPTLDLGDCSNKISLDFSFFNPQELKRSLKKLRLLREAIDGFADAFEAEAAKFQESRKTIKPKKKVTKVQALKQRIEEISKEW